MFHNNNSVTINKFKKRFTIPACFRNGKISYGPLTLNLKDWPFGVFVTWQFMPKSGHLNERVYCKSINRILKMLFVEGSGSFLQPTILKSEEVAGFGIKEYKYTMILKIFSWKNNSFNNLHKVSKNTVLNAMVVDLW